MAGLISSLFGSGAIGGSSAKTDRSNVLQGFSNLKNVFNWAMPFAKNTAAGGAGTLKSGIEDLDKSGDYYKKLVSGNRPDMLAAVAPETAAVTSGSDAAKRQIASSGTARGGGVASTNQQREDTKQSEIDKLLFSVRPEAAKGLASVGQVKGQLGEGQELAGIQAGMLGANAATDLTKTAITSREDSEKIHHNAVNDISSAIEDIFSGIAGIF